MTEKLLQQIMALYENSSVQELEVTIKDLTVKLKRQTTSMISVPENQILATEPENTDNIEKDIITIKSPLVGVYYEAKAPNEPPFVKVGDYVTKGQVLAIVEAMKIMNHITAPSNGVVTAIHMTNGDIIEFDQIMMELTIEGEDDENFNS